MLAETTLRALFPVSMEFDWQDAMSERNLLERGFGFDFAATIFFGRTLESIDGRRDCGEVRVKAVGEVQGVILVVICMDRENVRGSSRRERPTGKNASNGTSHSGTVEGSAADDEP